MPGSVKREPDALLNKENLGTGTDDDALGPDTLDPETVAMLDAIEASALDKGSATRAARPARHRSESMYVELLQEMICTVLGSESFLFSEQEHACLTAFLLLPYGARYLFVRLLQRKRDQWYRLDRLAYEDEVASLPEAVHALSRAFAPAPAGARDTGDEQVLPPRFAIPDAEMPGGVPARLELLTLEELRALARRLGVPRQAKRGDLIRALLAPPKNATLLALTGSGTSRQLGVSFAPDATARLEAELRRVMHGGCVCLEPDVCQLMERVTLVYHRGRPALGKLLTAAVLSRSRRCHFPRYTPQRTVGLFRDRQQVVHLERALEDEAQMDTCIDELRQRPDAARDGVRLLDDVLPRWQAVVQALWVAHPQGVSSEEYQRLRFHPGWVLTRVVYKGCECLARLAEHSRETHLLRALLAQRFFRRGRRGAWYDRLALITARYATDKPAARQICLEALSDHDTHIIFVSSIQRRLARLEAALRVPPAERHRGLHHLRESRQVVFHGTRLSPAEVHPAHAKTEEQAVLAASGAAWQRVPRMPLRGSTRSMWVGRDAQPCHVEEFCLQQYARQGFRGFHCEGGVLIFLFTLLMWDVLFMPAEGAFETAYQRGPLDLSTDVSCIARKRAIEERLAQIEATGGVGLLCEADTRERPRRTWAIGCRWDAYTQQELCEICECFGGRALALLFRLLCEDWDMRTAGFPDLCLWRYRDRQLCLVEVKGPGDRLSEKQKVGHKMCGGCTDSRCGSTCFCAPACVLK